MGLRLSFYPFFRIMPSHLSIVLHNLPRMDGGILFGHLCCRILECWRGLLLDVFHFIYNLVKVETTTHSQNVLLFCFLFL